MTALAGRVRLQSFLFYGWYIALAGAATNFLIGGIVNFGFGVFIEPMRTELGWSLGFIAFVFSLRSFQGGAMAPITGLMLDRIGPRRMSMASILVVALGLVIFSQAHDRWTFFFATAVMSLGQSLGGFTTFSAAIVHWFNRKRGRAMGIMTAGNGAGYLFAPVLAVLIDGIGWRSTLMVAAGLIVVVGIPLSLIIRNRPQPYGYHPDGDTDETIAARDSAAVAAAADAAGGFTLREALALPAFYLLSLAIMCSGPTQNAYIVFQVPHMQNVGYSLTAAALFTGGYGLVQIPLRFAGGWIADHFGRRRIYILSFLLQGAGLLIFVNMDVSKPWLLPLFYATYAVGHGLYVVLFMTMTADYFGPHRFASIQGLIMMGQMPLGFALPVIAGLVFDHTGTYSHIFLVYAAMTTLSAVFVLLVRRPTWTQLSRQRRELAAEAALAG